MKKKTCLIMVLLLLFTSLPAVSFAGEAESNDSALYIEIDGERVDSTQEPIEVNALSAYRQIAVYCADGTDISDNVKWASDRTDVTIYPADKKHWIKTNKAEVGKTAIISATDEKTGESVSVTIKLTTLNYEKNSVYLAAKGTLKAGGKAALKLYCYNPDRKTLVDDTIGNYILDHVTMTSTNNAVLPVDKISIFSRPGGGTCWWKLEAIAEGSTTVTLSVDDEYLKWEYSVDLATETGLILSDNKLFMEPGQTEKLTATVKPAESAKGDTTFESKDTKVATVSADGQVTAIANGDTEITVKNGDLTAKAVVSVRKNGIYKKETLEPLDSVTVNKNETLDVEAYYGGREISSVDVRWQSDNTGVIGRDDGATDIDGKFVPVANGRAKIRALKWDMDAETVQEIASIPITVTGCTKDAPVDPEENYAELNGAQGSLASGKIRLNDYRILYNTVNQTQYENYITAPAVDPAAAVFNFTFTGTGKSEAGSVDETGYLKLLKPHVKLVNASGETIATVGDGIKLEVTGSELTYAPQADVRITIDADCLVSKQKYALIFDFATPAPIIGNTSKALIFRETAYNFTTGDIVVKGIMLNKSKTTMTKGTTEKLQAMLTPKNPTIADIYWTSSNGNVANVDQTGTVTAIAAGTAVITATTKDGGYKATCEVTVQAPQLGTVTKAKASSAGYNAVKVNWKPVTGAAGYQVYRSVKKKGPYKKVKTTKSTSYTNKKLKTGKSYYFKVRAYQVVGGGNLLRKVLHSSICKTEIGGPSTKSKGRKEKSDD